MSWICGACRWQNFTPNLTATMPCVNCGSKKVDSVTPEWFVREVPEGTPWSEAEKESVRIAQRALRLTPTGTLDFPTAASLRGLQRLYGIPVTGILDASTAIVIDGLRPWVVEEEERPCRPY